MLEIGVMYSDNSIVWKDFTNANLLAFVKTGVLFMSFTEERGNRSALVYRHWSRLNREDLGIWHGQDIYYVGINPGTGKLFTHALDQDVFDFRIRDIANPSVQTQVIEAGSITFPPGFVIHTFFGETIDPDVWKTKLTDFEMLF